MELTYEDLIRALGPEKADKQYSESTFPCPFCIARGLDTQGSLHVDLHKNVALCHSCGYGSRDLRKMYYQVTGKRLNSKGYGRGFAKGDAVAYVEKVLREETKERGEDDNRWDGNLPKEMRPITFPAQGFGEPFADYLRYKRRLSVDVIERSGAGYCLTGDYAGRVIFPIFLGSELLFFTTRIIRSNVLAKVVHCPKPKDGIIYNIEEAMRAEHVYIGEGVFDALSIPSRLGVGVAVMGHFISDPQMRVLASLKNVQTFSFMYDNDSYDASVQQAYAFRAYTDAEVRVVDMRCCHTCSANPRNGPEYMCPNELSRTPSFYCKNYRVSGKTKDLNDCKGHCESILSNRTKSVGLRSLLDCATPLRNRFVNRRKSSRNFQLDKLRFAR